MEKYYKISIPKPCDEDWDLMISNQNGRFCDSCKKTVVDFTQFSKPEVQEFLSKNRNQNVCGRLSITQLEGIRLKIPIEIVTKSYAFAFKKTFLLAVTITMGTTLLSCTNTDGNQQKIERIEIIKTKQENPLSKTTCGSGSIPLQTEKKSIETIEEEFITMGLVEAPFPNGIDEPIPFASLDEFPSFPKILKKNRSKRKFENQIKEFVSKEFNEKIADSLGIVGIQKIYTQFRINTKGIVEDIKIRASHPVLEKEARRVLEKLPKFNPGNYQNKKVACLFSLPIVFKIEE